MKYWWTDSHFLSWGGQFHAHASSTENTSVNFCTYLKKKKNSWRALKGCFDSWLNILDFKHKTNTKKKSRYFFFLIFWNSSFNHFLTLQQCSTDWSIHRIFFFFYSSSFIQIFLFNFFLRLKIKLLLIGVCRDAKDIAWFSHVSPMPTTRIINMLKRRRYLWAT